MDTAHVLLTTGQIVDAKFLIVGMGGAMVDISTVFSSLGMPKLIDEEALTWLVAEYLPCPKTGFRLVFEATGRVQVVYGA